MGQLGHGNLYTEKYFYEHNPATAVAKLRQFTRLPRPRIVDYIMDACKASGVGAIGIITQVAAWGQQSAVLTSKGKVLTWGR